MNERLAAAIATVLRTGKVVVDDYRTGIDVAQKENILDESEAQGARDAAVDHEAALVELKRAAGIA